MTTPFPVYAGQHVSSEFLNEIQPLMVIKPSDQDVTSSTTLTADDALFAACVTGATYLFDCFLDYEGGTQGSSDIKWAWSVPSGSTLRYGGHWIGTGGGPELGLDNELSLAATVNTAGTDGAGTLFAAVMTGSFVMSSTPGNLQLEWAQNSSDSTPTIVHAQSFLRLSRVS